MERLEGRTVLSYAGGLDFTYGTQGVVDSGVFSDFYVVSSAASVMQPDGDLIVVGSQTSVSIGEVGSTVSGFSARRYTPDGSLDPSFGDMDLDSVGQVANSHNAEGPIGPELSTGATGVALESNGQILVVGNYTVAVGDTDNTTVTTIAVMLNSDGTLDTSFGTDGIATLGTGAAGGAFTDARAVAALSGGLIAVAGLGASGGPAVEVLDANGSVDTNYGTDGVATVPVPTGALALAPSPIELAVSPTNGEAVLVANAALPGSNPASEIVATEFTSAGTPDTTFGAAGQALITGDEIFATATAVSASAIAFQPNGDLVVGGSIYSPGPGQLPEMVVLRLTTAGAPDPTFGIGGFNIPSGGSEFLGSYVDAMAVQSNGDIVMADGLKSDYLRLLPDGLPDPTFGTEGRSFVYTYPQLGDDEVGPATPGAGAVGVAVTPAGKILVTQDNSDLTQLLGIGSPNDFDEDGISDTAIYLTSLGEAGYAGSTGAAELIPFGSAGLGNTLPAPGAYDGFGVDELGVFIPATADFGIQQFSSTSYLPNAGGGAIEIIQFGIAGAGNSLPAPGDYDGSGKTEVAVYLPTLGVFAYRPADGGPDVSFSFGIAGAGQTLPAPGDYFGTGQDDVAAYLPSMGAFEIRNPDNGQDIFVPIGPSGAAAAGIVPAPGDYDGSGRTEVAIYEPSTGDFVYLPANGGPAMTVQMGIAGAGNSIPVPGDYDGSGHTEFAVYLPGTAVFAYRPADGGPDHFFQVGVPDATIPFTLNAAMVAEEASPAIAVDASDSAEIPLTPDVLDELGGTFAKKKGGADSSTLKMPFRVIWSAPPDSVAVEVRPRDRRGTSPPGGVSTSGLPGTGTTPMSPRSSTSRTPKIRSIRRPNPNRLPAVERLEGRAMLSVAGSPDLTYGATGPGANGYASYSSTGDGNATTGGTASVLQPNGDLIVVGSYFFGTHGSLSPFTTSFSAVRLTPAGQLDTSFDSTTLQAASLQATYELGPGSIAKTSTATGVALQSDGDIVVVGEVDGVAKVARLTSGGAFDTTFGTGGIVTLGTVAAGDGLLDYASAVAILPGGQIAVAGATSPTVGQDTPVVEVLDSNGTIDTSYGTDGLATVPLPAGASAFVPIASGYTTIDGNVTAIATEPLTLVEQADGSLVLSANVVPGGGTGNEVAVTRLTLAGAVDTTFGTAGQATITPQSVFPGAPSFYGTALSLQPGGDLIVGGGVKLAGTTTTQMAVVRLTSAGAVDTTFGVGGVNILPIPTILAETNAADPFADGSATVGAIATEPGGRIVVADQIASDFARLNANGTLDNTFGTAGQMVLFTQAPVIQNGAIPTSNENPNDLALGVPSGGGSVALTFAPDGDILATTGFGAYALLNQGASGDYDGDGKTDPAVYLTSSGTLAFIPSSNPTVIPTIQFGIPGAGNSVPAPGAYGGEGVDEPAVYLPTLGVFAVLNIQNDLVVQVPFGLPGTGVSLPAPGDYDKSGATELAVYIPGLSTYVYRPGLGGADVQVRIGGPGAIPAPADYFGTGQDDVAVFEPATATFIIQDPTNGQLVSIPFGVPGDSIPVPGDYDGSGHTELAVYVPSLAEFIYRPANGGADVTEQFGIAGVGATIPAVGDYDGSGKAELAAYFPGSATFAYRPASGSADVFISGFGAQGATIPFDSTSATDLPPAFAPEAATASIAMVGPAEIPLTPDVLDALSGTTRKKGGGDSSN